jgi:hypothetical protein
VQAELTKTIAVSTEDADGYVTTSSKPGGPPAARSGELLRSLFIRNLDSGIGFKIGSELEYAGHLQYGTKNMPRRPWLFGTVRKYRKQYYSGLNLRIRQAAERQGVQGAKVRFR